MFLVDDPANVGFQAAEDAATNRPILVWVYDNLDELTGIVQYDGDGIALTDPLPATKLRTLQGFAYDDLGQLDQVRNYSVDPSTGAVSADAATNSLVTSIFHDRRGNEVATYAPGGLVTKAKYDGAGRLVLESATDGAGGAAWSNAITTAGDHVLAQTRITYDAASRPILVARAERFHNAPSASTGDLITATNGRVSFNGTPISRVSYSTAYYDAADRVTATVDLGTNGGTTYSRPAAAPARSDQALVTSDTYDVGGRLDTVTDPRGLVTRMTYDLLGRTTRTVAGYNSTINGGRPTTSANATTSYTYNGIDQILTVTAVMPTGTPSQTTTYAYGATTGSGSGSNNNDWLRAIVQPDKATGASPSGNIAPYLQLFSYTAQGEIRGELSATSDANGTTHVYSYDAPGRRTSDAIVQLGAGVDGSILRRQTAYDGAGRAYRFTTYNASSGGSAITDVLDTYNGFGQLIAEYQEQAGLVNTATSLAVRYTYTEMAGGQNNSRLTRMTYPNGRAVNYLYSSPLDQAISRVSAIADDGASITLEGYSYLGLGNVVERLHQQTGVNLTYVGPATGSDGGDQYAGLDRFGRVIDQNWSRTTGGTAARYQYGYDRDGNALYRKDLVAAALSELYHANPTSGSDDNTAYDALGRLTGFARGVLSASTSNTTKLDTVANSTSNQSWSLDALGNWSSTTKNGSTTSKTFNAANQASTATFDNNGNTLTDSGKTYTYDAWNRLKSVRDSSGTVVAGYAYDALDRRVVEVNNSSTKFIYFAPGWQVIEERTGGLAAGNVSTQYVMGVTGALVLRDSYTSGVLSTSSRLYALNNANGDIMALVDTPGAVQERYAYDAYGTVTVLDGSGTARGVNASTYGWRYLFQGGRSDSATGLYVFGYRDYDPTQGRWIERDPLGLAAGDNNIYRFVGNNPVNVTDPLGLFGDGWFSFLTGNNGAANLKSSQLDDASHGRASAAYDPFDLNNDVSRTGNFPTNYASGQYRAGGGQAVAYINSGATYVGEAAGDKGVEALAAQAINAGMQSFPGGTGGAAGGGGGGRGGRAGGGSGKKCNAPNEPVKGGIYEFPDQTAGNIPYVGQSSNVPKRLKQHQDKGRLTPGTESTTPIPGNKTAREIAEHNRIQQLTGGQKAKNSPAVSNKADPIGPNRRRTFGLTEPID